MAVEPNGRNGLINRTLATIFATLICAGILGIFASTWRADEKMETIRVLQVGADGELKVLVTRVEQLVREVERLHTRVQTLEQVRIR